MCVTVNFVRVREGERKRGESGVCEREGERERERVCVREREKESVCVCVRERERERERETYILIFPPTEETMEALRPVLPPHHWPHPLSPISGVHDKGEGAGPSGLSHSLRQHRQRRRLSP